MKRILYYFSLISFFAFIQPIFVSAQKSKGGNVIKVLNAIDDQLHKSGIVYFKNHKLFGISEESHKLEDTETLKFSTLYEKHFDLFWVPVWTYDITVKTSYVDFDSDFRFILDKNLNFKTETIVLGNEFSVSNEKFKMNFFQRYLGKLIALICLIVCIRLSFPD